MLIRTKTAADAPACRALLLATHTADGYPRYLPSNPDRFVLPAGERAAWVAEKDGEVVGHVAVHDAALDPTLPAAQRATGLPAERLAVIARLMVSPSVRRAGVGRALLEMAGAHAREHRQRLVLDVVQDSTAPQALYEALGWTRLEALRLDLEGGRRLNLWVYLGPEPEASWA